MMYLLATDQPRQKDMSARAHLHDRQFERLIELQSLKSTRNLTYDPNLQMGVKGKIVCETNHRYRSITLTLLTPSSHRPDGNITAWTSLLTGECFRSIGSRLDLSFHC